jgi:hypothetical protein
LRKENDPLTQWPLERSITVFSVNLGIQVGNELIGVGVGSIQLIKAEPDARNRIAEVVRNGLDTFPACLELGFVILGSTKKIILFQQMYIGNEIEH